MNKDSNAYRFFTSIPIALKTLWLYLPGVLIVLVAKVLLWDFTQGKDVMLIALESGWASILIMFFGLFFLAFIIWYSGRLVAYSHDELYNLPFGKVLLFHGPRFIAYLLFFVVIMAFFNIFNEENLQWYWLLLAFVLDIAIYIFLSRAITQYVERACKKGSLNNVKYLRNIVYVFIGALVILSLILHKNAWVIGFSLMLIHWCLLFLVIIRRYIAEEITEHSSKAQAAMQKKNFLTRYLDWILKKQLLNPNLSKIKNSELYTFVAFHIVVIVSVLLFIICTFSLWLCRSIGPLGLLFLCLGIILSFGNFVSLLSAKLKTNVFVLLVVFVFLVGLFSEPHKLRTMDNDTPKKRIGFRTYVKDWVSNPQRAATIDSLKDSSGAYPVFMVLSDGGASRSGYWVVEVLSKLTDDSKQAPYPFHKHLFCLSGASGGSVGNGTYAAALANEQLYLAKDTGFETATTGFLKNDFLSQLLVRMLGTDLMAPVSRLFGMGDRAGVLEKSLEHPDNADAKLTEMIGSNFENFYPDSGKANNLPIIAFNVTRMQDGQPGVFCNIDLDSLAFGSRIDIVDSLNTMKKTVRYSTAMITSARFPYVSPAGMLKKGNHFVDGGYFDNSGAGLVHEMLLEIQKMKQDSLESRLTKQRLSKLKFYVIHIVNNPYGSEEQTRVHPFTNDLAAPLLTIVGSYQSQTSVNNLRLEKYLEMQQPGNSYIEVNLYTHPDTLRKYAQDGRVTKESYPMNWVISNKSLNGMNAKIKKYPELDSIVARLKRRDTDIFKKIQTQSSAPAIIQTGQDAIPVYMQAPFRDSTVKY